SAVSKKVTPRSTAVRMRAIISCLSAAGPYPKLMPMQPSRRPRLPGCFFQAFASVLRLRSKLDHDLDRLAFLHRAITLGHLVDAHDPVEDPTGLDPAFEDVRQELLDVRAHRSGAAAHADVVVERGLRGGHRRVLRHSHSADRAARPRDLDRRQLRLLEADALEGGVDAEAVGELAHALDRLVASLADDLCRAELPGE